jgi:hypothetical protein
MKSTEIASRLGICLLLLLHFASLSAGNGGPDPYGYRWIDSNEPNLDFQWVDIVSRPGAVNVGSLADDNAVGPFNIGWDFHYYWSNYNSIKIGSNGWVSFNNVGNIASCFPTVPTPSGIGDNIVAPFMCDLTFISNDVQHPNLGEMWYWTNNIDSFVVQWVDVPFWRNATPDWIGHNTFQMILSGVDSSITFQYLDTDRANFPGGSGCQTYLEIGIENVTGDLGLNYTTLDSVPPDNFAVKYIYPSGASFLVPDATPTWNANADNAGQFIYLWDLLSLTTNISNVGNTPITSTITASGSIRDLQLAEIWHDSASLSGLVNGNNAVLTFPDQAKLFEKGQYYFNVATSTAGGQDINPTNNTNSMELDAVANENGLVLLSYASNLPPTDAISWAGGSSNDGIAVKMIPPAFPATIDSVKVFITGDGNLQTPPPVGYTITIFGLDAQGLPDPSNPLKTINIPAANVTEDAWNTVAVSPPVTIASRGFAVAWLQAGSGIAIGAEQFGPISRRTYEILGGSWSPYRNNAFYEVLMRVYTGIAVGIPPTSAQENTLQVFPVPADDRVHVAYTLARAGEADFSLLNLQGQRVWQRSQPNTASGAHDLDLEVKDLPAGLYFLQMQHRSNRAVAKIIVE